MNWNQQQYHESIRHHLYHYQENLAYSKTDHSESQTYQGPEPEATVISSSVDSSYSYRSFL